MVIARPSEWIDVRRMEGRGTGGRGIFARKDIPAGTLLERSPVILMPRNAVFASSPSGHDRLPISLYVFDWGLFSPDTVALPLGYGGLFNHSFSPNARYAPTPPDLLDFHAAEPIPAGREIFVNYHGGAREERPVLRPLLSPE